VSPRLVATHRGYAWLRFRDDGSVHSVVAFVAPPVLGAHRHRTRWRTPWQHLLGEIALIAGHRGVSHAR
jgi:hypothetical protein